MLLSQENVQNLRPPFIYDFVQTFEQNYGFTFDNYYKIVNDTSSMFYSFSFLIKHLLTLINSHLPCMTFTIKGLNTTQRFYFYIELKKIDISFRIIHSTNSNSYDICINTTNIFSIPYFKTTPEHHIYSHHINIFNHFYTSIENTSHITDRYISVSLYNFLKFKTIFYNATISYNNYLTHLVTPCMQSAMTTSQKNMDDSSRSDVLLG